MRLVRAFARFWWDFVVGDDWRIAAGVVAVLGAGALLVAAGAPDAVVLCTGAAAVLAIAIGSIVAGASRGRS